MGRGVLGVSHDLSQGGGIGLHFFGDSLLMPTPFVVERPNWAS